MNESVRTLPDIDRLPELLKAPPEPPRPAPIAAEEPSEPVERAEYGSKCGNGMSRADRFKGGRIGALRSGVMSFKQGRWPRGSQAIKQDGDEYRKLLEQACIELHGEVGLYAASVIQTAVTLETSARLWQKWLRDKWEDLKEEVKDRRLEAIGKARIQRDMCLKKIGLDKGIDQGDEDAWKEFWKAKPAGINGS